MMNSNLAPDCDVTHIWWISAFGGGRLVSRAAAVSLDLCLDVGRLVLRGGRAVA
jgi:hypothetical protein